MGNLSLERSTKHLYRVTLQPFLLFNAGCKESRCGLLLLLTAFVTASQLGHGLEINITTHNILLIQPFCTSLHSTIPQWCLASGRQQEDIGLRSVLTDQLLPDPTAPYVRLDEPIASSPPLRLSSAFLPVPSLLAMGVKRGRWHCLKTITAILPEDNKELMLYPTNDSNPFKCESKERKIITVSVWGGWERD